MRKITIDDLKLFSYKIKIRLLEFLENVTRSIFNLDKRFLIAFFLITLSLGLFTTILSNSIVLYDTYSLTSKEEEKLEQLRSSIEKLSNENKKFKRTKTNQVNAVEEIFDFRTQEEKKAKERVQLEKIISLFNSNSPDGLKMKIVEFKDDLESNTFLIDIDLRIDTPVYAIIALDYISKYCYIDTYSGNKLRVRLIQNEEEKI